MRIAISAIIVASLVIAVLCLASCHSRSTDALGSGKQTQSASTTALPGKQSDQRSVGSAAPAVDWDRCIVDLSSADGQVRVTATKQLFADPAAAVAALHRHNTECGTGKYTGEMFGKERERMILDLLEGLPSPESGSYSPTSFGISVDHATTRDQVAAIGREEGFVFDDGYGRFSTDTTPSCYVGLVPGSRLSDVLRNILCREPHVLSVNLNWIEH